MDEYSVLDDKHYVFDEQQNVTLMASYEKRSHILYLEYNDEDYENLEIKVYEGDTLAEIELPVVDDGEKELTGWSLRTGSLVEYEGTFDSDVTLYAIWKEYCTVSLYHDENGEASEKKIYKGEDYIEKPVKHGYEFLGWYPNRLFSGNPIDAIPYSKTQTE